MRNTRRSGAVHAVASGIGAEFSSYARQAPPPVMDPALRHLNVRGALAMEVGAAPPAMAREAVPVAAIDG